MAKTSSKAATDTAPIIPATPATNEIVIDPKTPFALEKFNVAKIIVSPIKFAGFSEVHERASNASKSPADYRRLLNQFRAMRQARLVDATGKSQQLDAIAFNRIPRAHAMPLLSMLDGNPGTPGEVVSKGDGISNPTLYALGTPLELGGDAGTSIAELEFSAPTMGAIECVLAEQGTVAQTLALIRHCAKPVMSTDTKAQALPSWAIENITLADGLMILQAVLPSFLE